ncbi:MAG: hypothetical protein PWQ37_2581 [Candidatus Petromonas sp.]|jgi:hypothetical protein|nr:hypothetical protein [Candidatus Petromonas sp.]
MYKSCVYEEILRLSKQDIKDGLLEVEDKL